MPAMDFALIDSLPDADLEELIETRHREVDVLMKDACQLEEEAKRVRRVANGYSTEISYARIALRRRQGKE